jgi:hypothetical protein
MQNLDISVVKSPSATDTKDGSAFESLQSLEIRISALNWIMLLLKLVIERILTECEGNCLEKGDFMQLDTNVYDTALRYFLSNETTQLHMLQDSNFHSYCIKFIKLRRD